MRRKLLASIAAAAVVSASFIAGASSAYAASPDGIVRAYEAIATDPGMLKVLQLGDSYSSGTGAHPFADPATYVEDGPAGNLAECTRSNTNYGQQLAEQLGAGYVNAACGGAVFPDIMGNQNGNVQPQIDAVDNTADIVLMTMGGNDFGFGGFAVACFVQKNPTACQAAVAQSASLTAPGGAIEQSALANLEAIRAKLRPDAKFLWLGYPRLSKATSVVLDDGAGTTYDYIPDLTAVQAQFAAIQQRVVAKVNAEQGVTNTYVVDTIEAAVEGHEIDQNLGDYQTSNPPQPTDAWWIGIGDPYGSEIYHPKQVGWDAMAKAVSAYYAAHVAPTAQSASSTVQAGQSLAFNGEGWKAGAVVTASLVGGQVQSLQNVTATADPDEFGNVAFSLAVDPAAPAGTNTAQFADGYGRIVTVEFAVTAAPVVTTPPVTTPPVTTPPVTTPHVTTPTVTATAPTAPVKELANTGTPSTDLGGIAAVLLLAGGSLLWVGRRRTV